MSESESNPAATGSLWGGRFQTAIDPRIDRFNRSFAFDRDLFKYDVEGCRAWAEALAKANVISSTEGEQLVKALTELEAAGCPVESDAEDIHSFIEGELRKRLGDTARKLHTGRSRNDQVATAFRLWTRAAVDRAIASVVTLRTALVQFAEQHGQLAMPGYTHLQRAMPVLLGHWSLAYFEMLGRDEARLKDLRRRVNVMPLGSGALAGTSQPVDRAALAKRLGFEGVTRNSLDAVSDRDFAVEYAAAASLIMVHLSRLSEDVILYSSQEFGFFALGDAISTGSSLMPQKKNPDPMELVRGKSGRVFGHLTGLLAMLKGLPMAYNKDMQEDKEALFDTAATIEVCLEASGVVLAHLTPQPGRMASAAVEGYLNATELADYLARKGVPFREAHEMAGKLVLTALKEGVELDEMELKDFQAICKAVEKDVYESLSLEKTLASKNAIGGTSKTRFREALTEARAQLKV